MTQFLSENWMTSRGARKCCVQLSQHITSPQAELYCYHVTGRGMLADARRYQDQEFLRWRYKFHVHPSKAVSKLMPALTITVLAHEKYGSNLKSLSAGLTFEYVGRWATLN